MVCRTNPSVAAERRGKLVKLRGCKRVECACIHHTAYLVFASSRSGHRSPNSRNTETAEFPVEMTSRVKHALERRAKVPHPFSLRINIHYQLSVYQCVLEWKAGIFVVREVESFELVIVVVPVQLVHD